MAGALMGAAADNPGRANQGSRRLWWLSVSLIEANIIMKIRIEFIYN